MGWVALFVTAGYFFGNMLVVAHSLEYLVVGIIAVSLLPALWQAARSRRSSRRGAQGSTRRAERSGLPESPDPERL